MSLWRATNVHPRELERLTLGELGEWIRQAKRAERRRARRSR